MAREALAGSMGNRGQVFRDGDTVLRPVGPHTPATTALLQALAAAGFPAPRPLGITATGEQRLSWIEGEVTAEAPYADWCLAPRTLESVGALLRSLHDTVAEAQLPADLAWAADFADPRAGEHGGELIICHNDVCPPNVVFSRGVAVALLDFDYAAPGRPVWDLAQLGRLWVRLGAAHAPAVGPDYPPFLRLARLIAGYGLERSRHPELVDALWDSWRVGMEFVAGRAAEGQAEYVEIWARHHGEAGTRRALGWLSAHREAMLQALSHGG